MIQILDKSFDVYIPEATLEARIKALAEDINQAYAGRTPLFVSVLNGSFMFTATLFKYLTIPCEITFIRVASYHGTASTGSVKEVLGLQENPADRDIILLEDIIDTGRTLEALLPLFGTARSVAVATLLFKPEALQANLDIAYVGFEIPNRFVVGYGLDYLGQGRNLPCVYQLWEG